MVHQVWFMYGTSGVIHVWYMYGPGIQESRNQLKLFSSVESLVVWWKSCSLLNVVSLEKVAFGHFVFNTSSCWGFVHNESPGTIVVCWNSCSRGESLVVVEVYEARPLAGRPAARPPGQPVRPAARPGSSWTAPMLLRSMGCTIDTRLGFVMLPKRDPKRRT